MQYPSISKNRIAVSNKKKIETKKKSRHVSPVPTLRASSRWKGIWMEDGLIRVAVFFLLLCSAPARVSLLPTAVSAPTSRLAMQSSFNTTLTPHTNMPRRRSPRMDCSPVPAKENRVGKQPSWRASSVHQPPAKDQGENAWLFRPRVLTPESHQQRPSSAEHHFVFVVRRWSPFISLRRRPCAAGGGGRPSTSLLSVAVVLLAPERLHHHHHNTRAE